VQRFYMGGVEPLGQREVGVIAATSQLARDGHIIDVRGIDLTNYLKNPIVLFSHSPQQPVGVTTAIGVRDNALAARIKFAPAGVSATADQCYSLVAAGVLRGVSIGFDPDLTSAEPLDPKRPRGGQRYARSELLEISFVSLPADVGASVIQRSVPAHRSGFAFSSLRAIPVATVQRAFSRLLPRSGRRLSAETQRSLRTALEHHRTAMRCQRDAANVIEDLLDRDDGDDGERSRVRLRLQIMRRRWSPAELERLVQIAAIQRLRERKHGESPERVRAKLKRLRATAPG
jgi:HK97 family phage prohead protease